MIASSSITVVVVRRNAGISSKLDVSLKNLVIPPGYSLNVIYVDSSPLWQLYNFAMSQSDSKYKIYLHENIEIRNDRLLIRLLDIFRSDAGIGIIGCSGAEVLSTHGVCLKSAKRCGKVIEGTDCNIIEWDKVEGDYKVVDAVDGYFMATQYDIPWRADLFKDSFGDTAQCIEFKLRGYRSVVVHQDDPWIWLREGNFFLDSNDHQAFLDEYSKYIFPLVSVLITTHNRTNYLVLALESALKQSYRNIEVVISDDSTNEDTHQVIESRYLGQDDRLRYYRNPGLTTRSNKLFLIEHRNRDAEYVTWLDDDDYFHPSKIEMMVEAYRTNMDVALVTSARTLIDEDGQFRGIINPFNGEADQPLYVKLESDAAGKLLFMIDNYIGEPDTVLLKQKYLECLWRDTKFYFWGFDDVYAWLQILKDGALFWINQPLSCHRVHPGAGTSIFDVSIGFAIDWGVLIKTYWEARVFLKTEQDIRNALMVWFRRQGLRSLELAYANDYHSKRVTYVEFLMESMSAALTNGFKIDISCIEKPSNSV